MATPCVMAFWCGLLSFASTWRTLWVTTFTWWWSRLITLRWTRAWLGAAAAAQNYIDDVAASRSHVGSSGTRLSTHRHSYLCKIVHTTASRTSGHSFAHWTFWPNAICNPRNRWRGGATGRALDLRWTGRGFKSYSGQSCVTTLGKLSTPMCLCHQAV